MPVTAEDVARAAADWVRAKRKRRKSSVITHCRDRLEALTGHWMSDETTVSTQQKVVTGKTQNNGNIHGTTHKAA